MTPAARLEAARVVLAGWLDGQPAERALSSWARGARYAGSKDRRAVRDHVYDILRQKGVCAHLGGGEDARALILGLARLQQLDVGLFSEAGYGPAALNPDEAALLGAPVAFDRARDTPQWLREKLMAAHSDWVAIENAMAARAPLYLRVNTAKAARDDAQAQLMQSGIETDQEDCPTALKVTVGAAKLLNSRAYADGLVEPQDLSVQHALARVDWPQGQILDYCAGGGGKALAIAAATGGPVDIHDAHPRRMVDAHARAVRAGAVLREVAAPKGPYDLVLTDVPCSGTGTWRRDPDAKWRLEPSGLSELLRLQATILDAASALSGRVVYMTCSLLAEENMDQVTAFLTRHPGWKCNQNHMLTPVSSSDGFFMAELVFGRN